MAKASSRPVTGSVILKHGAWHWRRYEGGKQVSTKLADLGDQYRTKRDVVPLANAQAARLNPDAPRSSNARIVDFVTGEYLPWIAAEKRPATADGYKKIWAAHLEDHFADRRLSEYAAHHASAFLTKLAKDGMGRNSVAHVRSVMSAIFRHAIAKGYISANPIRDAALLTTAKAPTRTGAYDVAEIRAILLALQNHPQSQLAVALGFFLGLRTAEIAGLKWSDISDDWSTIYVQRSIYKGEAYDGKTATSKAVLPLIEPLRSLLRAYKEKQPVTDSYILISSELTPVNLHWLAKRYIKPMLTDAGLEFKGFYAGRRGLATLLANSQPLAAQGMLRHASLNTTQAFYIKAVPSATIEAMKQLEAVATRDNKGQE